MQMNRDRTPSIDALNLMPEAPGVVTADPDLLAVLLTLASAVAATAGLVAGPAEPNASQRQSGAPDGAERNASGDHQVLLDVAAHELFVATLRRNALVQVVASEEATDAIWLNNGGRFAVAFDPLDGSSNVSINAPIGSIFSVLPGADPSASPDQPFLVDGDAIVAAGLAIFGPRTILVLGADREVSSWVLDTSTGTFALLRPSLRVPEDANEFAINTSNYRHWQPGLRRYIDDLFAGADGPRGADFNMRWIAAVVAEAYRILIRGGIYLYPADSRPRYERGRLRLLYEGHPIAWLIERAGGAATDGNERILNRRVGDLHEHTPLVFGSTNKVERVRDYDLDPFVGTRSPLFSRRGLYRD